jgi:hypothetical protein
MGGKTSVPGPSPEERALQAQQTELLKFQTDILKQQQQQQKVLLPFLADQQGYSVQMDDTGNITGITKKNDPLQQQNDEITGLLNKRTLDALHGDLPVDPALETSLHTNEQQMRERLSQQFGPGYETSTPGIETLGNFMNQSEQLRYGARTGQLTLGEQLGITRQQQDQFTQQTNQDVLRQAAFGDPMSIAGAYGQVAKGYGQAQQPYIQQRQLQAQVAQGNAQRQTSLMGAGIGLAGMALFSDADGKADMIPISKTKDGIPIYMYTRKDTGERMLGVLSTDVEIVLPDAVRMRDGWDVVNYEAL